jgi:hypothetical protein
MFADKARVLREIKFDEQHPKRSALCRVSDPVAINPAL